MPKIVLAVLLVLTLSLVSGMPASSIELVKSNDSRISLAMTENETTPMCGGTLRMSAYILPETLNPLLDVGSAIFYPTSAIMNAIFSCLVAYDATGSIVPELACSWEASEDLRDYTFHLYDNITWHDSAEFNASDVKFTYDTILHDPEVVPEWNDYYLNSFNISSVEIADRYTVVFHLENSDATFPVVTGRIPIIPCHLFNGTDLSTNPYNDNPVGTGPFKFVNWTPNVDLTVAANENYHKGRPYLDEIYIKKYSDVSVLPDMLLNNTIDVIPDNVDPARIQELTQVTGVSALETGTAEVLMISLNFSNPILNNLEVRRALAHAINSTRIIEDVLLGYGTAATGPVPPVYAEWKNSNVTSYEYNKTLSEQLLDEAGYPRDNVTGVRFSIEMKSWAQESSWGADYVRMIRSYWPDVGVNTTLKFIDQSNDADAHVFGFIWDFNDPHDLSMIYESIHSGYIPEGYNNTEVENLLEQGRLTSNQTLRKQIYDQAQSILVDDLPIIYLWYPTAVTAYNNDFHGFIPYPFGTFDPSVLSKVWYQPTLSGKGNCPYRICFLDSEGRRTGYYDGIAYEDIPESSYSGIDSDPQVVKIREPAGIYTVELVGTANGSYKFEFANVALDYKNVWVPEGYIHENGTITYIVRVCQDGSMKVYDFDKFSEHDVGIRSVTTSKTVVGQGCTTSLNVAVFNWGNFTENFNLTVYADTTVIAVQNVTLPSGNPTTSAFVWNTTGLATGNYSIKAVADAVPGEIDTTDNNVTGGWVTVAGVGDLTGGTPNLLDFVPDGQVNMKDVGVVARFFNQNVPPAPANCDVTGPTAGVPDGIIDMRDIGLVARHFGDSYP